MTDKECKHCEHFDLFTNICMIDNKKCYENKKNAHVKNVRITKTVSGNQAIQIKEREEE